MTPQAGFTGTVSEESGSTYGSIMPKRDKLHDEAEELAYDKNPIGAGSMELIRHFSAEMMKFEHFDDYYYQPKGGLPEDRRVKFTFLDMRLVPEEATRVAAIRTGEADIAPVSLQAKKQVEAGGGRMLFPPEAVVLYAQLWGCYQPEFPCKDRWVRQALAYAIDKEPIQGLMEGPEVMQIKGWNQVSPSTIGYGPGVDPFLNQRPDERLSKCPECHRPTHLRKFALLVHIDGWGPMVLAKTRRYCARCEVIIAHQNELEAQLAESFGSIAPEVIGNKCKVLGTVEKRIWQRGPPGSEPQLDEVLKHTADFKQVLDLTITARLVGSRWYST